VSRHLRLLRRLGRSLLICAGLAVVLVLLALCGPVMALVNEIVEAVDSWRRGNG